MTLYLYYTLLGLICFLAISTFLATRKKANRYGRYMKDNQKNTIDARLGWLIFESPQAFSFAIFFWLTASQTNINAATITLFALWQGHYIYRALIYPWRMKAGNKKFPMGSVYFGLVFNAANGFVNAYAVGHAEHLMTAEWLSDPRFIIGLVIAQIGWLINFHSDSILVNLRAPGETGYKIPQGGAFRYVSGANYLGEIILWCGWAIMSWTPAGLIFALFTIANLGPRALSHHQWYLDKFPDYPKSRKALIPGVL